MKYVVLGDAVSLGIVMSARSVNVPVILIFSRCVCSCCESGAFICEDALLAVSYGGLFVECTLKAFCLGFLCRTLCKSFFFYVTCVIYDYFFDVVFVTYATSLSFFIRCFFS